jgi:basic membrane protein A and related proteins
MSPKLFRVSAVFALALVAVVVIMPPAQESRAGGVDVADIAANPASPQTIGVGLVVDGANYQNPADSFNWLAYQGLLRAQAEWGVTTAVYTTSGNLDYMIKLQQCALDGQALCIGVGPTMADALVSSASIFTGTKFAGIDTAFDAPPDNLRGLLFAEDEAGYLAGTLAGLMSPNHLVGVVGGDWIPVVVRFTEGYRNGAQCAIGRNLVLATYAGTFTDPALGAVLAQEMIAQSADVLFGAAGSTGDGAILTATQSGYWAIGIGTDQYVTLFGSGSVAGAGRLLSSAMKRVDNATFAAISDVISGTFTSGHVIYGVANQGVDLAPFHETDLLVPQNVRDAIDRVRQGIVAHTLDISNDCRTYLFLPVVMKGVSLPSTPELYPIDNPDGDGSYTVNWSSVDAATNYTLQEGAGVSFSSPITAFSGLGTSTALQDKPIGTYSYRVRAENEIGVSPWSETQTVTVTVAHPLICQTYNFGTTPGTALPIMPSGVTWTLPAEHSLTVKRIETLSNLKAAVFPLTVNVEVYVNDTQAAEWDVYVNLYVYQQYIRSKDVSIALNQGDAIKYVIKKHSGDPEAWIRWGNYVKLCGN